MCLTIKPFSRKQIAEQDIEVFKVLRSSRYGNTGWRTPYRKFPVVLGETLEAKLFRGLWWVNDGIHSYSTYSGAVRAAASMRTADIREWFESANYSVIKAVIPKGAEFYFGSHEYEEDRYTGSYASNKLTILREFAYA